MQAAPAHQAVSEEAQERDHFAGDAPSALSSIHAPGTSIAIWHRRLAPSLEGSLAEFASTLEIAMDRVVRVDSPESVDALPELGHCAIAAYLREDVSMLLRRFVALSEVKFVRLALGLMRNDACRKFHTDNVRLRLLTTYVGPGTEWVPNSAVDRAALAHPAECPCDANAEIVRDMRQVRRAGAGDVVLLRGERYGGGPAAVHRSPPIEALGLVRLVLALTAASS